MTGSKVEEVAKAILKTRYYDCEPHMYDSLAVFYATVECWDEALCEARAAIAAMREPTESMISASGCECDGGNRECIREDYQAMIDAASAGC